MVLLGVFKIAIIIKEQIRNTKGNSSLFLKIKGLKKGQNYVALFNW